MSYQSASFLLFAALVLILYYAVGRPRQKWVIAGANLAFFAIAGVRYLPFVLTTILATFFAGKRIGRIYSDCDAQLASAGSMAEKKALRQTAKSSAKVVLIGCLAIVVGLLVVCKYSGFILNNANYFLRWRGLPEIQMFKVILPLGISFYTFISIGYVLDIFWKRYKAETDFVRYAAFLAYFPHVVQGPIDRYHEFRDQTEQGVALSYKNLSMGAQLTIWGFFKKVVIADRLGILVDTVLDNHIQYDGIFIILALAVYSIQIYADFSGCIDIVSGVSEMLGIRLRKNFNHPYFSRTMAEFWRRWHMSLQEWFKDYIYYPVSVSRLTKAGKKKLRAKGWKRAEELFVSCFPVLVVWLITGIWHGADWKFVAWGLFHAGLLIGSQVFEPVFARINLFFHVDTENFGWHFLQMTRTFILCCIGRIFFRAKSISVALDMIRQMRYQTHFAMLFDTAVDLGLNPANFRFAVISMLVLLVVDILQERMPLRETLAKQNIIFRWIIIFAGLITIIIFGNYGPEYNASSFIYEQF